MDRVLNQIATLPNKKHLWEWKIQWTVMSPAAVALIVGGIIGGPEWIKTH